MLASSIDYPVFPSSKTAIVSKHRWWNCACFIAFPFPRNRISGTRSRQRSQSSQYSSCSSHLGSFSDTPIGRAHSEQQHSGSLQPDSPHDPRLFQWIAAADSGRIAKVMAFHHSVVEYIIPTNSTVPDPLFRFQDRGI